MLGWSPVAGGEAHPVKKTAGWLQWRGGEDLGRREMKTRLQKGKEGERNQVESFATFVARERLLIRDSGASHGVQGSKARARAGCA